MNLALASNFSHPPHPQLRLHMATRHPCLQEEEEQAEDILGEVLDVLQEDDWEDEDLEGRPIPDVALEAAENQLRMGATEPLPLLPPMPPLPVPLARPPGWVACLAPLFPPTARGVPPHKWAENMPDPFLDHDPPEMAAPMSIEDVHLSPAVFLVYLMVSWLHLQFHLPFRACNTVLLVFTQVVCSLGVALGGPAPLSTLTSAMSKLELEPSFSALPVCPTCFEVYPIGSPSICSLCNTFIYKSQAANTPTCAAKTPRL